MTKHMEGQIIDIWTFQMEGWMGGQAAYTDI